MEDSPARATLRRLFRHRLFLSGLALFGIILAIAAFAPWITTADPIKLGMRYKFQPPGSEFVFGTDNLGRSLWSRMVWGARLSVEIGIVVVSLNAVFGTVVGAISGYFRVLDGPIMRVNDALMAFPAILLAIAVAAVLGASVPNVIIALAVATTPHTARIVRASVLVVRAMDYVEAARAIGMTELRVLLRHVLPNTLGPLIVRLTYVFATAILAEAALSFIGVGPPPPAPTFGNIIAGGRDFIGDAPWITLFPGLAVIVSVLGLNLLGDGLRDVLDPRARL